MHQSALANLVIDVIVHICTINIVFSGRPAIIGHICTIKVVADVIRVKGSEQIGSMIRRVRKEQHIDQASLALICGFSERPLKAIERGEGSLSADKLFILLNELGIKVHIEPPSKPFMTNNKPSSASTD